MKKILSVILMLILCMAAVGCGGSKEETKKETKAAQSKKETKAETKAPEKSEISVSVTNGSDYIFNELYVSPTAADEWGDDHLGSTSILKSGGSFEIKLMKYDFDKYDIMVIDEDKDTYLFSGVPLQEGSTVEIAFTDGLTAAAVSADGTETQVAGEIYDSQADGDGGWEDDDTDDGSFAFTIYNESGKEIYAAYIGPADGSLENGDVLESTLEPGASQDVEGSVTDTEYESVTDWIFYAEDADGITSPEVATFDPFTIQYVDILWDTDSGSYVCDFHY